MDKLLSEEALFSLQNTVTKISRALLRLLGLVGNNNGRFCWGNKIIWRLPDTHWDVKWKVRHQIMISAWTVGYLSELPYALLQEGTLIFLEHKN